ncbi:hypothetical protein [Pseudocolwellia agarivorans]|uniref:hypothetical protein n=1 Tax=Pseudocolwellia agarivorans TaxID=1911682 RepID=UPI000985F67B|nr:hypothetical protein [Pseudocolwellia agarivorans]
MNSRVEFEVTGRSGNLIYAEEDIFAKAYVEMSGSNEFDMLVDVNGMGTWSNGESISEVDLIKIREAFKSWAQKSKYRCQW